MVKNPGGRGIGMGNTCKSMAVSFQCMTKSTTKKKKKHPAKHRSLAGDAGSIPGSRRSPGVGNDRPLQHSCLENSMDRGAMSTVHGAIKSWPQLSTSS